MVGGGRGWYGVWMGGEGEGVDWIGYVNGLEGEGVRRWQRGEVGGWIELS